jgi:hypothetical protein
LAGFTQIPALFPLSGFLLPPTAELPPPHFLVDGSTGFEPGTFLGYGLWEIFDSYRRNDVIPNRQKLEVAQDADASLGPFQYWYPDPTGGSNPLNSTPYDFSGFTLSMEVRVSDSASSALVLGPLTPGNGLTFVSATFAGFPPAPPNNHPNAYTITLTAAQTVVIPVGKYSYDIFLINQTTGLRTLWQKGVFEVTPTVTR